MANNITTPKMTLLYDLRPVKEQPANLVSATGTISLRPSRPGQVMSSNIANPKPEQSATSSHLRSNFSTPQETATTNTISYNARLNRHLTHPTGPTFKASLKSHSRQSSKNLQKQLDDMACQIRAAGLQNYYDEKYREEVLKHLLAPQTSEFDLKLDKENMDVEERASVWE